MQAYRNHVSIIASVLESARECSHDNRGASVTHLIRTANVPYKRLCNILGLLNQCGLVQFTEESRYRISDKGIGFLNAYVSFKDFAETFGLTI